MGPPLDGMGLGVAQSARGGGGEPLEQLAVVLVERSGTASLVDDLDRPDGDAPRHHRRGHDGAGDRGLFDLIGGGAEAGILDRFDHHGGARVLDHVADEPAADRHLRTHHALRRAAAHGKAAAQHVTFSHPERSPLGIERGKHAVEDPREQLVQIQGGVEFEGERVQQAQPGHFLPKIIRRGAAAPPEGRSCNEHAARGRIA